MPSFYNSFFTRLSLNNFARCYFFFLVFLFYFLFFPQWLSKMVLKRCYFGWNASFRVFTISALLKPFRIPTIFFLNQFWRFTLVGVCYALNLILCRKSIWANLMHIRIYNPASHFQFTFAITFFQFMKCICWCVEGIANTVQLLLWQECVVVLSQRFFCFFLFHFGKFPKEHPYGLSNRTVAQRCYVENDARLIKYT